MSSSSLPNPSDPARDDAAAVYRALRDFGAADASTLADRCFPVSTEGPPSSLLALRKRSVRRVLDAVVWLRAAGVVVWCVPSLGFALTADAVSARTPVEVEVARETPSRSDAMSEVMDVWHAS